MFDLELAEDIDSTHLKYFLKRLTNIFDAEFDSKRLIHTEAVETNSVKILDASFQGCADLQELLQPISSNLDTSQLSPGSLQERLQINNLGFFHLTLLETNKEFF